VRENVLSASVWGLSGRRTVEGIALKDTHARLLPPILLTVVAVVQIALVRTGDLTAWKGGGFGMFSTLDHGAFRRVDIVVEATERSEEIELTPSLEVPVARAVTFPSQRNLTALAQSVVERERRYAKPVETVRLQVWRQEFDPVTLHATERLFRTFSYRVE
jgi:hypothetical protein